MNKPFLAQLTPQTRKILAKYKAMAMSGDLEKALLHLDQYQVGIQTAPSSSETDFQISLDLVSISLLKAHLLHLDFQGERALMILQSEVLPKSKFLPNELELAINQNKSGVEVSLFKSEGFKLHNLSYDERELIGIKFWNPERAVYAYEYAAEGRHYDSLPAFLSELDVTYRRGSWSAYEQACRRIANELLQLGDAPLAAFYAVNALSNKLIEKIGGSLLFWRNAQIIEQTIRKIIDVSYLKRHAHIASVFFRIIADAIPDNILNDVFERLFAWAKLGDEIPFGSNLNGAAWEALFKISRRLDDFQAERIIHAAIGHTSWSNPNHLRKHLLRVVNALVPKLAEQNLVDIANAALPTATTHQDQADYGEAISLLCQIAEYSEEAKTIIGNTLYENLQVPKSELHQLAPIFGRSIIQEDVEPMAARVINDIRLQVQHYEDGDNLARPSVIFSSLTGSRGKEKTVVYVYAFGVLQALLTYRKMLSPATVETLVESLLEMVCEPHNIPPNKQGLLEGIVELADCLTADLTETVFEKLYSIADGEISISVDITGGLGDPNNPLNPNKIDFGKFEDVRGCALLTLVRIEENNPGIFGNRIRPLIEKGMVDEYPGIRQAAFAGLQKLNLLGEIAIMNLLMGTRDPDPAVASQAWVTLAENDNLDFSEAEFLSLFHSLTLSFNSTDSSVRRSAAYFIATRETQWKHCNIVEKMSNLRAAFQNDICNSVREMAKRELNPKEMKDKSHERKTRRRVRTKRVPKSL